MFKKIIKSREEELKKIKDKFSKKSIDDDELKSIITAKKDKTKGVVKGIIKSHDDDLDLLVNEHNPFILIDKENFGQALDEFDLLLAQPKFQDQQTILILLDTMEPLARNINDNKRLEKYAAIRNLFFIEKKINKIVNDYLSPRKEYIYDKLGHPLFSREDLETYCIDKKIDLLNLRKEEKKGEEEGLSYYELMQSEAYFLEKAGNLLQAEALYFRLCKLNENDYSNYFALFGLYTDLSENENEYYSKAKDILQTIMNKIQKETSQDKAAELMIDVKEQYWQLCRKNERYEKAKEIVETEFAKNDLHYLLTHFRFNLPYDFKRLNKISFNAKRSIDEKITHIRKILLNNSLDIENKFLPKNSHLSKITEIDLTADLNKSNRFVLGHIYTEAGELEDLTVPRSIKVYDRGLSRQEVYHVMLHEIGHNAYFLLTEEEKQLWDRICKDHNLDRFYRGQKVPYQEMFADCYANFILFNEVWHEFMKDEGPARIIYGLLRNIFNADEFNAILSSEAFDNNVAMYSDKLYMLLSSYKPKTAA